MGPHGPESADITRASLKTEHARAVKQTEADELAKLAAASADGSVAGGAAGGASQGKDSKPAAGQTKSPPTGRSVDVEFFVPPPEPPFGHNIASTIR